MCCFMRTFSFFLSFFPLAPTGGGGHFRRREEDGFSPQTHIRYLDFQAPLCYTLRSWTESGNTRSSLSADPDNEKRRAETQEGWLF